MVFTERLTEILSSRHISKSKMLSDLKMGKNQFKFWESKGAPNASTIQAIAAYLSISPAYLTGESNDPLYQQETRSINELSAQEKTLLAMFRETSEEGRFRMIQAVMNIKDEVEKKRNTASDQGFAG